ncbi:uncharacterized protein CIMG_05972 [Coccidioides immitis RS]|uniref:Uncharacterized protein n=1 Tax=Coccidioides immitis (strain RS) TaxID=246410 RepID=A0A0E1RX88_COCIM|nr:uncharacterized protein CIMG_05972 [Coccidioides immitis RS]EAS30493.2 hypothetical protein CIMG_05972 [Coccidioides immitis RS]TPX23436.1 hypothetical protein DIZ76_012768 [Coccidioides immitis]
MATWSENVGDLAAKSSARPTPTEPPRALLSGPTTESTIMPIDPSDDLSCLRPSLETKHPFKENSIGEPELSRPALVTRQSPRQLQYPRSEQRTSSLQPTHRRARTDLFLPNRHSIASTYALEDVVLSTDQETPKLKSGNGNGLFGGLFQGESTPIRLGIVPSPTTEQDQRSRGSSPTLHSHSSSPNKKMNVPSPLKNITYSSPFSFFGAKQQKEQLPKMPEPADDEYLNLDIDAILFRTDMPNLPPEEALVNFQRNAENLVRQLQKAYKQRTFALHQALAEKIEQKEELEETQSRFQNMKSQLDGMAAKVFEQENEMKALVEELNIERQKRKQEDEARRRSIVPVRKLDEVPDPAGIQISPTKKHSKSSSGASIMIDSGFESADESISESIFSKGTDDTAPTRPASIISTTLDVPSPSTYQPSPLKPRPLSPSRPSAYDRVLKGISAAGSSLSTLTSSRCPNCQGGRSSDPGHVATILQEENRVLKSRITELETAIEECITLVGG